MPSASPRPPTTRSPRSAGARRRAGGSSPSGRSATRRSTTSRASARASARRIRSGGFQLPGPELRRRGDRRARRRHRGGDRRAAGRRPGARHQAAVPRRGARHVSRRPGARARADDASSASATSPLILYDAQPRLRRPDAPPARRPRPDAGVRARAADRGRARRDGVPARRARPRRHDRRAGGDPGAQACRRASRRSASPSRSTTPSRSSRGGARSSPPGRSRSSTSSPTQPIGRGPVRLARDRSGLLARSVGGGLGELRLGREAGLPHNVRRIDAGIDAPPVTRPWPA